MEKRAFLAIALSILVLVIYQEWVTRQYGTPPPAPQPENREAEKPVSPPPSAPAPVTPSVPVEVPTARGAKDVTVETENYVAVFTTQGARLKSFKFKGYRSSVDEKSPPFEIVSSTPGVPHPLGIRWQSPTPFDDAGVLYAVQDSDLKLAGDLTGALIFQGQTPNGSILTKKFTFSGSTYPIQMEVAMQRSEGSVPAIEIL